MRQANKQCQSFKRNKPKVKRGMRRAGEGEEREREGGVYTLASVYAVSATAAARATDVTNCAAN